MFFEYLVKNQLIRLWASVLCPTVSTPKFMIQTDLFPDKVAMQ